MWTLRKIWEKVPHGIAWLLIALDFIWEILQNICGLVVKLVFCVYGSREQETVKHGTCKIQNWPMTSGISLGWFQFTHKNGGKTVSSHEVGHSIQSVILGPLYLFVIGIPSIIWCALYKKLGYTNYYAFYTEKWADSIAGIKR